MNIEGSGFVEGLTGFTFVAGFSFRTKVFTIDRFGKYPGAGSFPDPPGPAKQISVGKVVQSNGISQGIGNIFLSYNRIKGCRPVFPGRYYIILHSCGFAFADYGKDKFLILKKIFALLKSYYFCRP